MKIGLRRRPRRSLSLRTRLTAATSVVVAAVVIGFAGTGYLLLQAQLTSQVDANLRSLLGDVSHERPESSSANGVPAVQVPSRLGSFGGYVQVVTTDGRIGTSKAATTTLPVTAEARALAAHGGPPVFSSAEVGTTRLRILTAAYQPGLAVQLALPTNGVASTLGTLRIAFIGLAVGAVVLAGGLGWLLAGTVLRPVRRLTAATEQVRRTKDLSHRINDPGADELGTLARSYNEMLLAVQQSVVAQRQLVADASHELRTPLTSLRTNVEVLASSPSVTAEERAALLADIVSATAELTALMSNIIELARGDEPAIATEPVDLADIVASALRRTRRNRPGIAFRDQLESCPLVADPDRLERAVVNVLDNAAKWSPPNAVVDVDLAARVLTVRDRGPGIPTAELPRIFDRFYRAATSRNVPGSGLGLAIVQQTVQSHGATVSVSPAPGGGTAVVLDFRGVREVSEPAAGGTAA